MSRDSFRPLLSDIEKVILDSVAASGRGSARQRHNIGMLKSGSHIWFTEYAAVGVNHNYNHFLVWTDLDKPGVRIKITHEIIADFGRSVMPAIQRYRRANNGLFESEWENRISDLLDKVVPAVIEGKTTGQFSSTRPSTSGVEAAFKNAVRELDAFTKRWDAQPND